MKLLLRFALLFLTCTYAYASIEEGQALLQKANEMQAHVENLKDEQKQLKNDLKTAEATLKKAENKDKVATQVQEMKDRIATLAKEQKTLEPEAKKTKKQADQIIKKAVEEDFKRYKAQNKELVKLLKDKAREYKVKVSYQEGPSQSNGAVMTMGFSKFLEQNCTLIVYISYSFYKPGIAVDYRIEEYTNTQPSLPPRRGESTRVVEPCPRDRLRQFSISFDSAPVTIGNFHTKIVSTPLYDKETYEEYSDVYEKMVEKRRDVLAGYKCEGNVKIPKDFMVENRKGGKSPFLKMLVDSKTLTLGTINTDISYIGQLVLVLEAYKNTTASVQGES